MRHPALNPKTCRTRKRPGRFKPRLYDIWDWPNGMHYTTDAAAYFLRLTPWNTADTTTTERALYLKTRHMRMFTVYRMAESISIYPALIRGGSCGKLHHAIDSKTQPCPAE